MAILSTTYNMSAQNCNVECTELLQNPNLEIDPTFYPLPNGAGQSFYDGFIPGWKNSHGTAHTFQLKNSGDWDPAFTYPNGTEKSGMYAHRVAWSKIWGEGFFQDIPLSNDPYITYHLFIRYQVKEQIENFPPNHFISFKIASNLVNGGIYSGTPPQNIPQRLLHTQHMNNYNVIETCLEFQLNENEMFDQIWVEAFPPEEIVPSNGQWTAFDNISLLCDTEALTQINTTQNWLNVEFSSVNASTMSQFVEYYWDFGDGNFSTQAQPVHTYGASGTYNVCLKVKDNNGCCGELCRQITVDIPLASCDNLTECIGIGLPNATVYLSSLIEGSNPVIPSVNGPFGYKLIQNSCFTLEGKLIIDRNVILLNTQWFNDSGSEIEVNGRLWSANSQFQACSLMWRGFVLPESNQSDNRAYFTNSLIRDAYIGIEAFDKTSVVARNSEFIDNYIGVSMGTSVGTAAIVNDFQKCTFEGRSELRGRYPGQPKYNEHSFIGIEVNNLGLLNVNATGVNKNTFLNVLIGIQGNGSNVDIIGAHFICTYDLICRGIRLDTSGPLSTIANNYFQEMVTGISISNGIRSGIWINENEFFYSRDYANDNGKAINVQNTPTSSVWVADNDFYYYHEGKCVNINNGLAYLSMKDNHFYIRGTGSHVDPVILEGIKNPSFIENNVINIETTIPYYRTVFNISNCKYLRVNDNIINDPQAKASGDCKGFDISGTDKSVFKDNTVDIKRTGFSVAGSEDVISNGFCCNSTINSNSSFHFVYENGMTHLRQNTLQSLDLAGDIGQQISAGNIWNISNGSAVMGNASAEKAVFNRFLVDQSVNGAMPATILPASISTIWFNDGGVHPVCSEQPDCGIAPYNKVKDDPNGPGGNEVNAPDCELVRSFYERLIRIRNSAAGEESPLSEYALEALFNEWVEEYGEDYINDCLEDEIITINPVVQTWEGVSKQIEELFDIDDNLEQGLNLLMVQLKDVSDLIEELAPVEFEEPDQIIDELFEDMAIYSEDYNDLTLSFQALLRSKVLALIPLVNALPENQAFMSDRKKVWAVYLKVAAGQLNLITTREWDEVRSIALKCPDINGQSVYEAQGLLTLLDEYISSDLECKTLRPRGEQVVDISEIKLYPNPGTGIFNIELPVNHNISTISISFGDSKNLLTVPVKGQAQVKIDMTNYRSGIYFYECLNESEVVHRGKIVLINP